MGANPQGYIDEMIEEWNSLSGTQNMIELVMPWHEEEE
jgi:hypothetical protein